MKKPAIAIIQARMSSSRLPCKVLKPLAGKAMIWHIYQRALNCKLVDKVIIATSTERSDDSLAVFCEENNLNVFREDLNNVLRRFLKILEKDLSPYFVWITGDCPLICPDFIDQQIMALHKFDGDVVWSKRSCSSLEGQGVHSSRSLFYINEKSIDPEDLEHVGSKYLAENPTEFRIVEMDIPEDLCVNKYRLTVDEGNDYRLMKVLYDNLYSSEPIDLSDALIWLDGHPDVANVNKNVVHKRLNIELEEKRRLWTEIPKAGVYRWEDL
ncbi:MAG: NTP transferase domain-containing protein [Pirellulales bacterium]|nr:NTP transferase domain-containing protein [Pirellulales bacterium]